MKKLLVTLLVLGSFSTFANMVEVGCTGEIEDYATGETIVIDKKMMLDLNSEFTPGLSHTLASTKKAGYRLSSMPVNNENTFNFGIVVMGDGSSQVSTGSLVEGISLLMLNSSKSSYGHSQVSIKCSVI